MGEPRYGARLCRLRRLCRGQVLGPRASLHDDERDSHVRGTRLSTGHPRAGPQAQSGTRGSVEPLRGLGTRTRVQAIRAAAPPGTQVGIADNVQATTPLIETPPHIEAATRAMREQNAQYLTVIREGRYTDA